MSTSRDRRVEETYEEQNDQRLDDLHSKIRTLRGVRVLEDCILQRFEAQCVVFNRLLLIFTMTPSVRTLFWMIQYVPALTCKREHEFYDLRETGSHHLVHHLHNRLEEQVKHLVLMEESSQCGLSYMSYRS